MRVTSSVRARSGAITAVVAVLLAAVGVLASPAAAVEGINRLTVSDGTAVESAGTIRFTIELSPTAADPVTVTYATSNGTATAGVDYTATTGTVTFTPGSTERSVDVPITSDSAVEGNETFTLSISDPPNASVDDGAGTGTIVDDDRAVSISDANATEPNAGETALLTFTVSLSAPAASTTTVSYATANDSATAGSDFTATSGTVSFAAGESSKPVQVTLLGDDVPEANERFFVNLSSPSTNATIADGQGQGTILDNDTATPVPTLTVSDAPAIGEGGTSVFRVTASGPSATAFAVDYVFADGTARNGADYSGASGSVVFQPGETERTIPVPTINDTTDEPDESYFLNLTNPTGATIADGQGQATITDNDDPVGVSINDTVVTEGATATLTISLAAPSGKTVSVAFATSDGGATAPADYTAVNGTVTFAPGETSKAIQIATAADAVDEDAEVVVVTLSNPSNASLSDATGTVTIQDDDNAPAITVDDVTVGEAATPARFVVSLSAPSSRTVTVDFATRNASATAPADYTGATGTLTFSPGQTSKNVDVTVVNDTVNESSEQFHLDLGNASNATLSDATGTATITDNDAGPELSINDVTQAETNSGTTTFRFTVQLSPASGQQVTVAYATQPGTAGAPADFTAQSGTLTFAAGETSKNIDVLVKGDTSPEASETFTVALSNATNAALADASGKGTILNDDGAPGEIHIADATVAEGNSGTATATFTVTRSGSTSQPATVTYTTSDGTATAPADYTAKAGTVSFAAGETTKSITVAVVGDTLDEADETFTVTLSDATNSALVDGEAVGTITDDDDTPSVSVGDVTVNEGSTGTSPATFVVTLSARSGRTVTVNYTTADGTATAGSDYTTSTGSVVFDPGVTSRTVTVPVVGDGTDEADETFELRLAQPTNATLGDGTGVATVTDDDVAPSIVVSDARVAEGDSGTTPSTNLTFSVSLSEVSGRTVTVAFTTVNGTATAPADYEAATGTLTFAPGETSKPVVVEVVGDLVDETNETLTLQLSAPTNATIADGSGAGVIEDDDGVPSLSISDVTVTEGDGAGTQATFAVSLLPASALPVTVEYATANDTATGPGDYTPTGGTLTFEPGETSKTVTVTIAGDEIDEVDERFLVNLSSPTNATLSDGQGQATIVDEDGPTVSIDSVEVTETDAAGTATFTVVLSGASPQTVTVDYSSVNGTAAAPGDFTAVQGTLTFAPGETTKTVAVTIAGDNVVEDTENFFVDLSSPSGATLAIPSRGTAEITDDDLASLSAADVAVVEGNSGTTNVVFTVDLAAPASRTITVDYATVDGTATAGSDYEARSGTLTFEPGVTFATVTVPVTGDVNPEANETLSLDLSDPDGATVADEPVATITNDDSGPTISVADVAVAEGDSGTKNVGFVVTLSGADDGTVTVAYATGDGTAKAPADYTTTSGTLTFAAGETTKTINVPVVGDTADEANETFTLTLSAPTGATIADGAATATINDDDVTPATSSGYWLVAADGGIFAFGDAVFHGSTGNIKLNAPIVDMAVTATGKGYWLVASDGGIFAFGDAVFRGSTGNIRLNSPVVAMAATVSGNGYWLVAADGGVFSFGDAVFHGSTGNLRLNSFVVGMAATSTGKGYWLVAADGGVFSFGDAVFHGSTGNIRLNRPVIGIARTASGKGYWLVATDGGIFAFGDAVFHGSTGNIRLNSPVVRMAATPTGRGYWMVATDGGVFAFGDAVFHGSMGGSRLNSPMRGMAPVKR